jgi:hypothetical protein
MRRPFVILAAVGIAAVAAAVTARLLLPRHVAPTSGTERIDPARPPVVAPVGTAPEVAGGAPVEPTVEEAITPAPDDASSLPEGVVLGGWVRTRALPLCGRTAEVRLSTAPGGPSTGAIVLSCEAAYADFPSGHSLAIRSRRGGWVELEGGWAPIAEIRTAETVVVDGREYWHDLFNSRVASVGRTRIVLKGDTDPCAAEVCGSAHGLWEQEQAIRERYTSAHPGGPLPADVQRELEAEVRAMYDAEERSLAAARKAAELRPLEERTLELPTTAVPGGKHQVSVEAGGYTCCT